MDNSIYLLLYCKRKIVCFTRKIVVMVLETIYVGRLDEEKGIAHLLQAITTLLKTNQKIILHIYGTGSYKEQIEQLTQIYPDNVFYYGWQKKNDILSQWRKMDYFIMPSQFLETFWLTACESLLSWVPVIGNKKWGLVPFIDKRLDISQYKGKSDGEKLTELLQYLIENNIEKKNFSDLIQQTQKKYNKDTRYRQVKDFLPSKKDILLVSDYINYNGGGIETHLHDSRAILEQHDHTTHLYGHQAIQWKFARFSKLFVMALSIFNLPSALGITYSLKKNPIWLIWWHSISRSMGRLPIALSGNTNQIITHHELWLFHPYPSKTYSLEQIPKARSLSSFILAGNPNNIIQKVGIIGKYILIRLIHKQLKRKVKTHIVPSEWMKDMVQQWHPESPVICIPHFVDIE